jgi:hypothetical protein
MPLKLLDSGSPPAFAGVAQNDDPFILRISEPGHEQPDLRQLDDLDANVAITAR